MLTLLPVEKELLARALWKSACALAEVWDVELAIETRVGREINFSDAVEFIEELAIAVNTPDDEFPGVKVLDGFEERTEDVVRCECGATEQTQAGWDAQEFFEDGDGNYTKRHVLVPEKCQLVQW